MQEKTKKVFRQITGNKMFNKKKKTEIAVNILLGRTCVKCNLSAANILLKSQSGHSVWPESVSSCSKKYKECILFGVCDQWEKA